MTFNDIIKRSFEDRRKAFNKMCNFFFLELHDISLNDFFFILRLKLYHFTNKPLKN